MIKEINENDWEMQQRAENVFPNLAHFFSKQKEYPNGFTKIYTIMEEDYPVGYMIVDIIYERMELIEIEVLKEKRRKGYGNRLIECMLKKATTENLENITLEVRIDNNPAISLYEKNGFKKVAIRKNYYQDVDGILMERKMM